MVYRRITKSYDVFTSPEAYISKKKNRLKQYGDNVYLNNSDEFEIELFNPTNIEILAKIKINGEFISKRGIALRPAERIYLERFIDNKNKFIFKTYNVSGDNDIIKKAINNNGLIEVFFYKKENKVNEYDYPFFEPYDKDFKYPYWYADNRIRYFCDESIPRTINFYSNTGDFNNPVVGTTATTGTGKYINIGDTNIGCTYDYSTTYSNSSNLESSIETGRVSEGNKSKQTFEETNGKYDFLPFHSITWKILPLSSKPITSSEIKNYCGDCGFRIKKTSFKYCPQCGNKLD